MFKKIMFLTTLSLLGAQSFASQQKSIVFGNGSHADGELNIFIDRGAAAPRCKCLRFSILSDDSGKIGATRVERIAVWVRHDPNVNEERASHVLKVIPIYRKGHALSPTKTTQVVYEVAEGAKTDDMVFQVVALKEHCMNPTQPECKNYDTTLSGSFTGKQLSALSPVLATDLID